MSILTWILYLVFDSGVVKDNMVCGHVDSVLTVITGLVLGGGFYVSFLHRGYKYLAYAAAFAMGAAVVATIYDIYWDGIPLLSTLYKVVLVPLLLMVPITFLLYVANYNGRKRKEANELLEQAQFEITHRLKNQLTNISSRIDLLLASQVNPSKAFHTFALKTRMMISGAATLSELRDEHAVRSSHASRASDLRGLITKIAKVSWLTIYQHKPSSLSLNGIEPTLRFDVNVGQANYLAAILIELINNIQEHAYEGIPDEKEHFLGISARMEERKLFLEVVDHGRGFPRFNELVAEAYDRKGMRIIREVVENYDGTITATPTRTFEPVGTTYHIMLNL